MIRWNRGSRDHHLHQREDAYLNLIPLIDILSVMVAFLLVYSVDVEVVPNSKGVEIPQSTADALPNHSVVVMITRDQVFVQGELVADIADIADPRTDQRDGLTLRVWQSLPYDVVKKVMATCTEAAYGKISLAVIEKEKPMAAVGLKSI